MKFIMLEGPSTSGKTTIAKMLSNRLTEAGFLVRNVTEEETLIPVLPEKDFQVHLNHLSKLWQSIDKNVDYVVADRFHLTSAAVTNVAISRFHQLEKELTKYDPLIVFLKIEDDQLGARIFEAMKHRGPSWKAHVEDKGTREDIVNWYRQTQTNLLALLENSSIPHLIFDASDSNYNNINEDILTRMGIK